MKLIHALIIMAIVILGLSPLGPASGAVVFSDNFNTENGGNGALNYNNFTNWTVTNGTVDLVGNSFEDYLPGNGLYVDLDGSNNQAGYMTSNTFSPGNYVVSFDLAGSQRGDTNTVDVYFGSLIGTITLGSSAPFTTYTYNVNSATLASLVFHNQGDDNVGCSLDNVQLQTVPLPPSFLLLGSGLVGLGLLRRKWSLKK
jgi:hypothetical protein